MWPEQEDGATVFSHVKLVARYWISCRSMAGEEAIEQHVLYNLVEGALLVDGRPIGVSLRYPVSLAIHICLDNTLRSTNSYLETPEGSQKVTHQES